MKVRSSYFEKTQNMGEKKKITYTGKDQIRTINEFRQNEWVDR